MNIKVLCPNESVGGSKVIYNAALQPQFLVCRVQIGFGPLHAMSTSRQALRYSLTVSVPYPYNVFYGTSLKLVGESSLEICSVNRF